MSRSAEPPTPPTLLRTLAEAMASDDRTPLGLLSRAYLRAERWDLLAEQWRKTPPLMRARILAQAGKRLFRTGTGRPGLTSSTSSTPAPNPSPPNRRR